MSTTTAAVTIQETPIVSFRGSRRDTTVSQPPYDQQGRRRQQTDDSDESISEFMPANNGVTGREPNTNPPNWPSDHRRVPAHRPPVVHADWVEIGGPAPVRFFLWTMFRGCELLRWAYQYPTALGLHDLGYFRYKIAGEW